jgi:hypothetical protein
MKIKFKLVVNNPTNINKTTPLLKSLNTVEIIFANGIPGWKPVSTDDTDPNTMYM